MVVGFAKSGPNVWEMVNGSMRLDESEESTNAEGI